MHYDAIGFGFGDSKLCGVVLRMSRAWRDDTHDVPLTQDQHTVATKWHSKALKFEMRVHAILTRSRLLSPVWQEVERQSFMPHSS